MRLASALGHGNVDRMLSGMTWKQFVEWQAFDLIDPVGSVRGDWQAASICATLVNLAIAKAGKRKKRLTPKDFLLRFTEARSMEEMAPKQDWRQMKMMAMMCAAAMTDEQKPPPRKNRK